MPSMNEHTPRCAARKKKWRRYVPDGIELPKMPGGSTPAEIQAHLQRECFNPEWYRAYCLSAAGSGTNHVGRGNCDNCNGNNHGEGELSPAWRGGTSGAARLKARSRISDEGQREYFDELETDPELLSLRGDIAKLRLIEDYVAEQVERQEAPWAVAVARDAATMLRSKMDTYRRQRGDKIYGYEESLLLAFAEQVTQKNAVNDKAHTEVAKLSRAEADRMIDLFAMLPVEELQGIITNIDLAVRTAVQEVLVQHNMETMTPEELQDAVMDALGKEMGIRETQERQRLLGGFPQLEAVG
jgi:hypothetical protein